MPFARDPDTGTTKNQYLSPWLFRAITDIPKNVTGEAIKNKNVRGEKEGGTEGWGDRIIPPTFRIAREAVRRVAGMSFLLTSVLNVLYPKME